MRKQLGTKIIHPSSPLAYTAGKCCCLQGTGTQGEIENTGNQKQQQDPKNQDGIQKIYKKQGKMLFALAQLGRADSTFVLSDSHLCLYDYYGLLASPLSLVVSGLDHITEFSALEQMLLHFYCIYGTMNLGLCSFIHVLYSLFNSCLWKP